MSRMSWPGEALKVETREKLQIEAQGSVSAEVLLALKRVPFHSIRPSPDWMRPIPVIESNLIRERLSLKHPS